MAPRLPDPRNAANDDPQVKRLIDDFGAERVADAVLSALRRVGGNSAVDTLLDTLVTDHMSDDAVEAWTESSAAGIARAAESEKKKAALEAIAQATADEAERAAEKRPRRRFGG